MTIVCNNLIQFVYIKYFSRFMFDNFLKSLNKISITIFILHINQINV